MKRITMSFGRSLSYVPPNPERTARKSPGADVTYQEWTNRAAMARSIRMQQNRAPHTADWRACVPLKDGEGY